MSSNRKLPAILGGKPVFEKKVPITLPTLPPFTSIRKKYQKILKSRMITNAKYVQEFECRMAEYLDVKYAIAVSSCTTGLMLTLKALDLQGEVIVPSFTFHATAHAVIWNGLKPVFVDCDPTTYTIDPNEAKRAISKKTSAILAVHIFGNPPDIAIPRLVSPSDPPALVAQMSFPFESNFATKTSSSPSEKSTVSFGSETPNTACSVKAPVR